MTCGPWLDDPMLYYSRMRTTHEIIPCFLCPPPQPASAYICASVCSALTGRVAGRRELRACVHTYIALDPELPGVMSCDVSNIYLVLSTEKSAISGEPRDPLAGSISGRDGC